MQQLKVVSSADLFQYSQTRTPDLPDETHGRPGALHSGGAPPAVPGAGCTCSPQECYDARAFRIRAWR